MVLEIEGVVKLLLPDNIAVPPVEEAYQSTVEPEAGVAEMATVPAPHVEPLPAAGAAGNGLMVAVTAVLDDEMQPDVVFLASA